MDRILILMSAADFMDAQTALYSALENAAAPDVLSFGVTLEYEPDEEAQALMAGLGRVQFLCPEADAWAAMPALWQGEGYVLMAHPAMRFTRHWDKALMKELLTCSAAPARKRISISRKLQEMLSGDAEAELRQPVQADAPAPAAPSAYNVLTGYLPVREDPLDAVCPVAANAFTVDGALSFHHGVPLRYTAHAQRGPFLHPDFCFGPAGFFRMIAQHPEEPAFLAAFREGWKLHTPTIPAIRLVWDLAVPDCTVPPEHELAAEFAAMFGVDFSTGALSAQSRRGMISEELNFRMKVPLPVRARVALRKWRQSRLQKAGKLPEPLCVTVYTADMPEETLRWLKRLAELRSLPLLAYAEPLKVRAITDFLPNVMEFKSRYLMDVPVDAPEHLRVLSKAAILAKARDRELTHSHYVWMDPDCVQYPMYPGAVFSWEKLCTDRISIAMVAGEVDTAMFVVPDNLVLTLAREMEARCLTWLNQRGDLPSEADLWKLITREHPEWFQLHVMPVKRQLFTLLDENE